MIYYSSDDPNPLKIMLLQLRKRRRRFLIKLEGDFVTKRNIGAGSHAQALKDELEQRVEKLDWKFAPRAKVAVTMKFFAWEAQVPAIHNLVKHYLDPLQGVVFSDDRQVGYLAASYWRPTEHSSINSGKLPSIYIHVERLTDYKEKFDLYYRLLAIEKFYDFLKDHYDYQQFLREDEEELRRELRREVYEYILRDQLIRAGDLPEQILDSYVELLDSYAELRRIRIQEILLQLSQINKVDRPGGPKVKWLRDKLLQLRGMAHLTIDLEVGDHALKGKSKQRKCRIRANLGQLKTMFRQILVPVEFDVCVVPRAAELGKDLDNIMREIAAGIIQNDLLHENAYLGGFRIYVVDNLTNSQSSGNVSVKLLSPHTVSEFQDKQQETFKIAKEWLSELLWRKFHIHI